MYRKTGERGFTLIELLVVIAIIGLLSSVVLASLNGARLKGRDARRISDLKQMQTALELYYSNQGSYPVLTTVNTTQAGFTTALTPLVSEGDIPAVAADPNGGTATYYYKSTAGGTFYCLGATMETTPLPVSSCNIGASGMNGAAPTGNYVVGP
jgi:prepilin-type N-terminal cleavage/methylation domain-containing protein